MVRVARSSPIVMELIEPVTEICFRAVAYFLAARSNERFLEIISHFASLGKKTVQNSPFYIRLQPVAIVVSEPSLADNRCCHMDNIVELFVLEQFFPKRLIGEVADF